MQDAVPEEQLPRLILGVGYREQSSIGFANIEIDVRNLGPINNKFWS